MRYSGLARGPSSDADLHTAFVSDPRDVRNWPVLDPLAPHAHAHAVARRADEAGIAQPTGKLFNELAVLSYAKARYIEAEPLFRRSLAIIHGARRAKFHCSAWRMPRSSARSSSMVLNVRTQSKFSFKVR